MNEAIQNIAILILVMVVVMITYSFHIDKNAVLKLNFSMEETKCWKGLLALFIVLDHLWMKYNLISLSIFHESAVILVSIFFFFSGYGVSINIRKNPDYMGAHFWKKRIGYLLLPMIFLDLIMFLWRAFEGDVNISFWNYLLGKELFNGQTWYIRELMICYIFFYFLIRKYKESKKVIAGCAAFLTLMNIILYPKLPGKIITTPP